MLKDLNTLYISTPQDRSNLERIRNRLNLIPLEEVLTLEVKFSLSIKYIGDFYGLLNQLGFSVDGWFVIMELNEIKCSDDFSGDIENIKFLSNENLDLVLR